MQIRRLESHEVSLHRELTRLGLWAPVHSPAAIALYRQAGFHETGRRRPLPTNPSLQILEMECEL